jgi:hypothetical protein
VPNDWELASDPLSSSVISQIIFSNGVKIQAEANKLTFQEELDTEDSSVNIPEISLKFFQTIPHLDYQAVGINFNAYISAESEEDVQHFILNQFIADGSWKSFENSLPNAMIQFSYERDNGYLSVTVRAARKQENSELEDIPILLFSSNYHHDILGETFIEKTNQVNTIIKSWKKDWDTFKLLVERQFLQERD